MRLTRYTDYALRVMLYLGRHPGQLGSIPELAASYGISKSHVMKIVSDLVAVGYVESVRGRNGGIRLARPPADIMIGPLVRHTEQDFDMADCGACQIAPSCGLTSLFDEAVSAFMAVLDRVSLADALARRGDFSHLLTPPVMPKVRQQASRCPLDSPAAKEAVPR